MWRQESKALEIWQVGLEQDRRLHLWSYMQRNFMSPRISGSHIASAWRCRLYANTQLGGSSLPYPFPEQSNPSALEIFHLSRESSASDIKKRCAYTFSH